MAQIISITLGTPPGGVSAWNLQFSADDGVTWTPYSTSSATPSAPEDLAISLLASGVYLLDGINSPTGNMAAASAAGLLYEARWKNAAGYGNWGVAFGVAAAVVEPTATTYSAPTAELIRRRTGVNPDIDGLSLPDFDAALLELLPDAEVRTALAVTPAVFDAPALTARQVAALQIAVSKRAGADYLRRIASKVVSGTETQILVEDAEAWRAQADALDAEAIVYDDLVRGVVTEDAALGSLQTGVIVITSPNEYLDSFRPDWRLPDAVVVE
jgi:hypothetical protein